MKIGDYVCLSDLGEFRYRDSPINPHKDVGVIVRIDEYFGKIRVAWHSSGWHTDGYLSEELELKKPQQPKRVSIKCSLGL